MCGPALISAGLQLYSARAQAAAQLAEGQAAKNYYDYQAKVNEQNAILAERTGKAQARVAQEVGRQKGKSLALDQARLRSSQRAALAASGIDLSSVTSDDIARDTFMTQKLDEATLRYNTDVQAFEAESQAQNQAFGLRTQAQGLRASGVNALNAAKFRSRSTLLGGVSNAFSSTFQFIPFLGGKGS